MLCKLFVDAHKCQTPQKSDPRPNVHYLSHVISLVPSDYVVYDGEDLNLTGVHYKRDIQLDMFENDDCVDYNGNALVRAKGVLAETISQVLAEVTSDSTVQLQRYGYSKGNDRENRIFCQISQVKSRPKSVYLEKSTVEEMDKHAYLNLLPT